MTRYELTIWKEGNKFGITKLFRNKKLALRYLKIQKEDIRYKKHQLLRIRKEFYIRNH